MTTAHAYALGLMDVTPKHGQSTGKEEKLQNNMQTGLMAWLGGLEIRAKTSTNIAFRNTRKVEP